MRLLLLPQDFAYRLRGEDNPVWLGLPALSSMRVQLAPVISSAARNLSRGFGGRDSPELLISPHPDRHSESRSTEFSRRRNPFTLFGANSI